MWRRWCTARRVPTVSTAALRPTMALLRSGGDAHGSVIHAREITTAKKPQQAKQEQDRGHNQARALRCLTDFSSTIRNSRTVEQLTTKWSILSRGRPLVVTDKGFLATVGAHVNPKDKQSTARVEIPADSLAIRMVRVPEMLSLIQQGKHHMVIHKEAYEATSDTVFVPRDRVLLVSDMYVARKMLNALFRIGSHLELTQFVEGYETESLQWRSAVTSSSDADTVKELTTLNNHFNALYIASLGELKEHAKMLEQFEQRGGVELLPILFQRRAVFSLQNACMMEQKSRLSAEILDYAFDSPTLLTFNLNSFDMAIKACLRVDKTLERLEDAMHVYRRMVHEAGYRLPPKMWTMLINACVLLSEHELAMEIFRDYRAQGIAPFQKRFVNACKVASVHAQYDTVIAMVRAWMEIEQQHEHKASPEAASKQADREAKCLNKILWTMLEGSPSRDQVEQVLLLMQSRGHYIGDRVTRRVVTHFFKTDGLGPDEMVSHFVDLWERAPAVIRRTPFVLQLVLEYCDSRGWSAQCDRMMEYALEANIDLPFGATTIKRMDQYVSLGQWDDAIQLGERALQPRLDKIEAEVAKATQHSHPLDVDQSVYGGIPDAFFERLLQSYVAAGRFDDVARLDDAFKLTARRSESNAALATVLQNAQQATSG